MIFILTLLIIPLQLLLGKYMYNKTFDFMVSNIGGKIKMPHDDVLLILIDQNAMVLGEELGFGRWPWPRNIYHDLLIYLNESNGPKAIFMDIMFASRDKTDDQNDPLFAQAIAENGNVFHNVFFQHNDETDKIIYLPDDVVQNFALTIENGDMLNFTHDVHNEYEMPLACLRADVPCDTPQYATEDAQPICAGLSIALSSPDADGVYRRVKALHRYNDRDYPSLALSAVLAHQNLGNVVEAVGKQTLKAGKHRIPLSKEKEYLINYHVKERIPDYSMSIVLESAISYFSGDSENVTLAPEFFDDKIVIIGVSAIGGQDLKTTPIDERTPGPEIHANMISNLLQDNHITQVHSFAALLTSLLLMVITVYLVVFSQHPFIKIASNVAIYTVYAVVTFIVFSMTNYLLHTFFTLSTGIIATTGSYMFLSFTEGAERRKYSRILGNMIDPAIVHEALNDLDSLKKGGEKYITAFFSDVASFSTISEKLTSAELAALLNEYLSAMTVVLKQHYGTLDKYIGDAIVGIFGAPVEIEGTALHACRASLDMHNQLKVLHEKWVRDNAYCKEAQSMLFRIGLNTGIAKVGFMGTEQLASYTMMGDTVNLASRLEAAGKDYGVTTLVSESTAGEAGDEMFMRRIDRVRVKGKLKPVDIYELISRKGEAPREIVEYSELYEQGFNLYQNRDWTGAVKFFRQSLKAKGAQKDKAVSMLIARCNYYKRNGPPEDWDGAFTRTHK